jgi:hypothetical protein
MVLRLAVGLHQVLVLVILAYREQVVLEFAVLVEELMVLRLAVGLHQILVLVILAFLELVRLVPALLVN